jgi:hypothetical protein
MARGARTPRGGSRKRANGELGQQTRLADARLTDQQEATEQP